jgi:hypothetical protein
MKTVEDYIVKDTLEKETPIENILLVGLVGITYGKS